MAILVVEDDLDLLDILCFALRREGHDVVTARDAASALEIWKSNKSQNEPQLVLVDADLPEVSGWDVCREIRKDSEIPIVMLTAEDGWDAFVRGFGLGVDGYLTWPFSHTRLVMCIRAVLGYTRQYPARTPPAVPAEAP